MRGERVRRDCTVLAGTTNSRIATEHILLEIASQGLGGVCPFEDRMRDVQATAFTIPRDRPQQDRLIHYVT